MLKITRIYKASLLAFTLSLAMLAMLIAPGVAFALDITTCAEFAAIENTSDTYELLNSINLSDCMTEPLDNFSGTLNGNGHTLSNYVSDVGPIFWMLDGATVSGLVIDNASTTNSGFAETITGSTVSDITFRNSTVQGGGVIALGAYNNSQLSDITIENTVTYNGAGPTSVMGGIVGELEDSSLTDSTSSAVANMWSGTEAGGIVGYVTNSTISNIVSNGTITIHGASTGGSIGGIAGIVDIWDGEEHIYSNLSFTGSYDRADGNTAKNSFFGGLIGELYVEAPGLTIDNATISADFSSGETAGYWVGGVIGELEQYDAVLELSNIEVSGTDPLVGTQLSGGLIGYHEQESYGTSELNIVDTEVATPITIDLTNLSAFDENAAAGGLIGYASVMGTDNGADVSLNITNTITSGDITTPDYYGGGFIGAAYTQVSDVYTGSNAAIVITNSHSTSDIIGDDGENLKLGGLIGATYDIDADSSIVSIAAGNTGGITISESYATGNVSASSMESSGSFGGLVGSMHCQEAPTTCLIEKSYASGNVTGGVYVGGLVGHGEQITDGSEVIIRNSYATGDISGHSLLGGLVGFGSNMRIDNAYSTGNVDSTSGSDTNLQLGGLAGTLVGDINNSFAVGAITSDTEAADGTVNALVGGDGAVMVNNFFDSTASGQAACFDGWVTVTDDAECDDISGAAADGYFKGNRTVAPFTLNSTVNWATNTWIFPVDEYPRLAWEDFDNAYVLTYTAGAGGSLSGDTSQVVAPGGSGSAVTATADSGYEFVRWSDNVTSNPRTDTNVSGDVSVSAVFQAAGAGNGGGGGNSGSVAGCTIVCQVKNLMKTGQYQAALDLAQRWLGVESVKPNPASAATSTTSSFTRDLYVGIEGEDVKVLQQYLNSHGFALSLSGPGSAGNETIRFGALTQSALARFQSANNITPAVGYFGPLTRSFITGK